MKTMTVRNIPDSIADGLSKRASRAHTSVNAVVLALLSEAVSGGSPFSRKRDLSEFCGVWSDKELEEFNAATESTRQIDSSEQTDKLTERTSCGPSDAHDQAQSA